MNLITKVQEGPIIRLFCVTSTNGEVAGELFGVYTEPNLFYVSNLYVTPQHRRQHVGSQLLEYLIQDLQHTPVSTVTLEDCGGPLGSTTLYTRLGFTYDEEGLPEMSLKLLTRPQQQ